MTDLERKLKFEKIRNEAIEFSKTLKDEDTDVGYTKVIMSNSGNYPSVDISCSQKTLYQPKENNL